MRRTRSIWAVVLVAAVCIAVAPAYVRAFVIAGGSDAPSLMRGDRVLADLAAYDVRVPYGSHVLFSRKDPRAGDMVLVWLPGWRHAMVKRIVAGPGQTVEMRDGRLTIDGIPLRYEPGPSDDAGGGATVTEWLGPIGHAVTRPSQGGSDASFAAYTVPDRHWFVLGDNRADSLDSREFGPVPREYVMGRIVTGIRHEIR